MRVKYKQTTPYVLIGSAVFLILLLIPFPQGTSLKAVVTAATQFQVLDNGNGSYTSVHRDLWNNLVLSSDRLIPDRGGFMGYRANTMIQPGEIEAQDTLGWLYSSSLQDKLISLEGNIKTLKASLEFERSGSRASEIEGARQQLAYARTRLEEQQKIVERSKSLLEGSIISQQEYDVDVRRERLDAIRVSIAEANLGSALSGAQASRLDVIRSRISDEETKLAASLQILDRLTLRSPISGLLHYSMSGDTLLSVDEVDQVVVLLPLHSAKSNPMGWASRITLHGPDFDMDIDPADVHVDEHIQLVNGEQLILARIKLDNSIHQLVVGQLLEASVDIESKSVIQMLAEMF